MWIILGNLPGEYSFLGRSGGGVHVGFEFHMAVIKGTYAMPRIQPEFAIYKGSTLIPILSLLFQSVIKVLENLKIFR